MNDKRWILVKNNRTGPIIKNQKEERITFSIIVVNWNGRHFLEKCLDSLFNTDYHDFEVILIDNASTDGSVEYVQEKYGHDKRLRIVVNPVNYGFAKASNIGVNYASKNYAIFLNNDTYVEANWLSELKKVLDEDPSIGCAQCLIVSAQNPDVIQTGGGFILDFCGWAWSIFRGEKISKAVLGISKKEIGVAYGAAMVVKYSLLSLIGSFDPTFVSWFEDIDLSWRVWLAGYKVVLIPNSIVYHWGGGSYKRIDPKSLRQAELSNIRNSMRMCIKNYSSASLVKYLPLSCISLSMRAFYYSFTKKNARDTLIPLFLAIKSNLLDLRVLIAQRRQTQKAVRKVTDAYVIKHAMCRLPLRDIVDTFR
jgi:hypothetical protein